MSGLLRRLLSARRHLLVVSGALAAAACGTSTPEAAAGVRTPADAFATARERMVRAIRAYGCDDETVLAVMSRVPRHEFVPEDVRAVAYQDSSLPIGHGQTISQPFIVAFMTASLRPQRGDKVLEVGTGSGYQAAVLAG